MHLTGVGATRATITVLFVFALLMVDPLALSQANTGELRVYISDPAGLGAASSVSIHSSAGQIAELLHTDSAGFLDAPGIPFGVYEVTVDDPGFAVVTRLLSIQSSLPIDLRIRLGIQREQTTVKVSADTLLDPQQPGGLNRIGRPVIDERQASLPGRSIIDLVNDQPGWLYEGNAVLHPRGSEYQTQYVMDGIPLTENRSPGFGVELAEDNVQTLTVYTAGFPAEYGRKMGGVIEVDTAHIPRSGLHMRTELSGGSFNTVQGDASAELGWRGRNIAGVSADGAYTAWFENPPVLQNFTNHGTTGDFAGRYERDLGADDRLTLSFRHGLARSLVPNEQLQQQNGQRQDHSAVESIGTAAYQHIFSPEVLARVQGMVRDNSTLLSSNALSTPIAATQDRGFRETYVKATVTADRSHQEWKAGAEADFINLHEGFTYQITDPTRFDAGTPATFAFSGTGRDREQAAFVEDTLHFGLWNFAAGLRWDHYKLLRDRQAVSPRLSISRSIPRLKLLSHFSWDRVFQTPAFENILLSSSTQVTALSSDFLRLPVKPSNGNYFEAGISSSLGGQLRLDVNYYLRAVDNYADDDQLLDTSVSFPIAFQKARIYGAEAKLELPRWRRLSGFTSYSYMVGTAFLPVTGGLFLGDDAAAATAQASGRFWDSQDQRNTVRTRLHYQALHRLWLASGAEYGTGLPTDFDGNYAQAVAQYGQTLVDRVNFTRDRVRPSLAVNASLGVDILHREEQTLALQVDGENLNNRINLIDFAGLFSGNAVAPPRSWSARLRYAF